MDIRSAPEWYQSAFLRGGKAQVGERQYQFTVERVGRLLLPSGRIVACDPMVGSEREPFVQAVLPGRYPVDLAIASDVAGDEERVLFARILFNKKLPALWVKALRKGEGSPPPSDVERIGYRVSSGTGAFMDGETADLFKLAEMDEVDRVLDDLVANYRPSRNWLDHPVDERHSVIMFSSGHGNGVYPSFFGIDEGGDVCLLLTAFLH